MARTVRSPGSARAWAELEILGAHAFAELEKNGLLNGKGEPRRLFADLLRLRQVQLAYARELAMTPASRMAIKASSVRAPVDVVGRMGAGEGSPEDGVEVSGEAADAIEANGAGMPADPPDNGGAGDGPGAPAGGEDDG